MQLVRGLMCGKILVLWSWLVLCLAKVRGNLELLQLEFSARTAWLHVGVCIITVVLPIKTDVGFLLKHYMKIFLGRFLSLIQFMVL